MPNSWPSSHGLIHCEQLHALEVLKLHLGWKLLNVNLKTTENKPQWGETISQCPVQKHHASDFHGTTNMHWVKKRQDVLSGGPWRSEAHDDGDEV